MTVEAAQASWTSSAGCAVTPGCRADRRRQGQRRDRRRGRAAAGRLPATAYPAILTETRGVPQALVSYRGNRYSVPPELAGAQVSLTRVLGAEVIDIVTASQVTIARHRVAADGAGVMVRDHGHVYALDQAAITAAAAAGGGRAHRRKERIPPGPDARAAADTLRRRHGTPATTPASSETSTTTTASTAASGATVTDLAAYERAAHGRNTLP